MLAPRWLPLNAGPTLPAPAPYDTLSLPSTCSVSSLRAGFLPFPFHPALPRPSPPTVAVPSSLEDAILGVRSTERDRKRVKREEKEVVELREMKRADVEAVRTLQDAHLPLSYPPSFYTLLLTTTTSLCLLAFSPLRPSSLLGCISARLAPSTTTSPTLHILSLVVTPSARRTGLAQTLLTGITRALLPAAPALSATTTRTAQISLHVSAVNTGALAFYKSLGLEEKRRVRGYYRRLRDGGSGEAVEMGGKIVV